MKKISIRVRLTVLSILTLIICCLGLTTILNISANQMADVIEATPLIPALDNNKELVAQTPPPISMIPLGPSKESQVARTNFLYQSILYMILVVAAGGGITYFVAGKALEPLRELSNQMKNRTIHNLSENLPVPESNDEIAELTDSFNQMSNKLDEAFAMQKRFSQSAAHELRTPLTVLKTKVDVFNKKKEHTSGEYDKLLSVITTHTDRLAELVKDLLDLTNMDALECNEQIELKLLLTDITQELASVACKKHLVVTVDGTEKDVMGNKSLLHRAFYNLIENAINYNTENGEVRIRVEGDTDKVLVTVSDTGIGIPVEQQELIFEPFFRVDKSRSRQMGGAGLGLATARTIIEKHNGSITVCTNESGGSCFTIHL